MDQIHDRVKSKDDPQLHLLSLDQLGVQRGCDRGADHNLLHNPNHSGRSALLYGMLPVLQTLVTRLKDLQAEIRIHVQWNQDEELFAPYLYLSFLSEKDDARLGSA